MPQLNTTYLLLIYIWTWFTLWLITQKTKTLLMNKLPMKTSYQKTKNLTPTLPWT